MAKSIDTVIPREEVFFELPSLAHPEVYIQFGRDGKYGVRRKDHILDEPLTMRVDDFQDLPHYHYSLPIKVGSKPTISLPFGLIILTGFTKAGKSNFITSVNAATLAAQQAELFARVIAVEPVAGDDLAVPLFYSIDAAIVYLVTQHMALRKTGAPAPLMVVDSLREALFEISGTAGEKGIINAFFTATTRLSNALASNGMTMLAIVNPMSTDAEYIKGFMSRLDSAVPAYINLQTRSEEGGKAVFGGQIAVRPRRELHNFTFAVSSKITTELLEVVEFNAGRATELPGLYSGVNSVLQTEI